MNYEEMSDFEVNNRVVAAVGLKCADYPHPTDDTSVRVAIYEDFYAWKDYCNNPSDAWPIILENKICILHDIMAEPCDGGSWVAQPSYGYSSERVRNDNPLRAAMIVFLMMHEQSHNCPPAAC